MKKIFLLINLLIIGENIFAQQSIIGNVTDENSKPIKDVVIAVKNTEKITTSDANGNYSIEVPAGYKTLSFQKTGFSLLEVEINSNILNIKMTSSFIDIFDLSLEELMKLEVVSASKTEQKVSDIPASVIVITKEEIENYGFLDVSDILKNISGLYAHDYGPGDNYGVRGFISPTHNRNITILINGMELRSQYLEQNQISTLNIPVESIERIEFIRGPMSVIDGNGAFFGVLNIITNNTSNKNVSIVSISGGLESTGRITVTTSGQNNDFKYALTGSYFRTDGREFEMSKMTDSLPSMDATFVKNAKSTEMFSKNIYHFDFSGQFKEFYFNTLFSQSKIGFVAIRYPIIGEKPKNNFSNFKVGLGYRKKFSKIFTLDAQFNMYKDEFGYENSRTASVSPVGLMITNPFVSNSRVALWLGEITTFIKPIENLDITLGCIYQNTYDINAFVDQYDIGIIRNQVFLDKPMTTQSGYLKADYWLFGKFLLEAGVRMEQRKKYDFVSEMYLPDGTFITKTSTYGNNKWNSSYNFASIFKLNEKNNIKAIYGTAFNYPAVSEFQYAKDPTVPLKSQEIQSFELIYSGLYFSKLSLSLSGFYNNLENLVIFSSDETGAIGYTNSGKIETKGAELMFIYKPTNKIEFSGGFTYQQSKDKSYKEEIDAGISPNYLANFKTSYRINDNINLSITGYYVSDMEAFWEDEIKIGGVVYREAARAGSKVDGYFNLGANIRIQNLPIKKLYLNLRGTNLLGTDIYYANMFAARWYKNGMLGQGRYIEASVGYKF